MKQQIEKTAGGDEFEQCCLPVQDTSNLTRVRAMPYQL